MQYYYLPDTRLKVIGNYKFISDSPLKQFCCLSPFSGEIVLNIKTGPFPGSGNPARITENSGICVDDIGGEKWLFSTDDSSNPCHIEAARDCSVLNAWIDLRRCADKKVLKAHFLKLLELALECNLSRRNGISVHASSIGYDGNAILFTAPSGTGKSTQADIWKEYLGAKIINGDRPFVGAFPEEVRAFGVPWDGKEQIFLQESYPVKAMVEVRQAKSNYLRKMSREQAFKLLMKQCFIPMWDDETKFLAVKTVRKIANAVPFYRLFCLPEKEAAGLLNSVLFEERHSLVKDVETDMKLTDGFILKNVVDEWIVMPTGKNIKNFEGAIVLNEVSAFIWKQLENQISRDDLLQAVLDEYDIDAKTAEGDIDSFLERLENMNLLLKDQ